ELVVTDTINLSEVAAKCRKIRQLSIDAMLSEAIRRVSNEESISSMFSVL
ncbi:MAG TPA: ribose-phosphate pyrophosphokinase, partial [Candidatus Berkiella sp.]|nr:ribose-phosphate pyrophosphokinase [Candidatus Berkiella sp.]